MIIIQNNPMVNRNDKIAIVSIIILVFLFLIISKTITSGYHFVDDHEVIRIKSDLKSSSLIEVSKSWVKEDLYSNTRFRPVYYIHRVFETKLLGSDFFLWSVYNGILFCLALVFLYLGMRNLKFTLGESIVFLIVTFIGPQSPVLWRLGPGEVLGMVFLGLAFFFMSKSLERRNHFLKNLLFIIFLILASLTKESFLIIVPAMIFFKIWNEKTYVWSSLKESVSKNIMLLIPLIVIIIEIYFIRKYVGISYSGLDAKFSDNILSIVSTTIRFAIRYLNLIIVGLILFISALIYKKRVVGVNLFAFVFFVMIVAPNIVLYSKTGMMERYLLPSSFGLGFLIASFIKGIEENQGSFKKLVLTLVLVSFLPYLVTSFIDAAKFSKEGHATKRMFSAISSNHTSGSPVMVIVDPVDSYEISVSLKTYLKYEEKIDLFGYCIEKKDIKESDQAFVDGWKSYFDGRLSANLTSAPELLIFLDNKLAEEFFRSSTLHQSDYKIIDVGDSPYALLKANHN
jgi:hypothetical protein